MKTEIRFKKDHILTPDKIKYLNAEFKSDDVKRILAAQKYLLNMDEYFFNVDQGHNQGIASIFDLVRVMAKGRARLVEDEYASWGTGTYRVKQEGRRWHEKEGVGFNYDSSG